MKVLVTSFSLQKNGNEPDENEDAFYPKRDGERHGQLFRFAVADGASESMLSGKWADILVTTFSRFKVPSNNFKGFLERANTNWSSWRKDYLYKRQKWGRPIQWFEEPGLRAGAYSTFLGLTLIDSEEEKSGKWHAIALGDTCVFQIRNDNLEAKFPLENSSEFNNRPLLVSSNYPFDERIIESWKERDGGWCVADRFYIMTDALATWFLEQSESSNVPWRILCDFGRSERPQSFENWIRELRVTGQIRNDDITLVRIDLM